ncbi:hypothetical protein M0R04_02820 [Candidatus Dojkabacteria bacterium]|jgi:hypothetical protein|nr:hypothetical protein [Candidatus Dojkabacteria bacterium]
MKKILKYFKNKPYLFATWFGITNPWGSDAFSTTVGVIAKVTFVVNGAIALSALVAVGVIVFGGITLITAAGDAEKVEKGSKAIGAAIIGMVIVFAASLIIKFVIEKIFAGY